MEINGARLLVLKAAQEIDRVGPKAAMNDIAIAKVVVPSMTLQVVDRAIQVHGAKGVGQDTHLPYLWAMSRTL